ncbi:MAG: hydroxymethylglutaryl-CoA lyase [Alphaproteobacteria bacterium]
MQLPATIDVFEVGPRDGLQNEPEQVSTDNKIAMVNALSRTGLKRIEVTSFVRPDAVPQMADAPDVMRGIDRVDGVDYAVLVPNLRGFERALEYKPDIINIVVVATETFNQRNARMSVDDNMKAVAEMTRQAEEEGQRLSAILGASFWCPWEGRTDISRVQEMVGRFVDLGLTEIALADTIGAADPKQVADYVGAVKQAFPTLKVGVHLHDTRGMGLANGMAGAMAGADWLEGSVGALGGCPFAPGAKGNAASEDLVHMLHRMGVATGIDLTALTEVSKTVSGFMGRPLNSRLPDAGEAPQAGEND